MTIILIVKVSRYIQKLLTSLLIKHEYNIFLNCRSAELQINVKFGLISLQPVARISDPDLYIFRQLRSAECAAIIVSVRTGTTQLCHRSPPRHHQLHSAASLDDVTFQKTANMGEFPSCDSTADRP